MLFLMVRSGKQITQLKNSIVSFYALLFRNLSNVSTWSFYITMTIAVAMELPADMLVVCTLNSIGRRWTVAISHFMSGLSMIMCAVFNSKF